MKLTLPKSIVDELVSAAREGAPLEACGLLAGNDGDVSKFYPMTNADASAEHFSMLPAEQFAAAKDMRNVGLELLAIWHSHPATPARMSEEDMRLAYTPGVTYVILSLAVPADQALRGFEVDNDTPKETEIVVTDRQGEST